MKHVLFITRKLRGRGGMQQYTQDIWRGLQEIFGDGAKVLGPRTRMGLIVFPFIAFFKGVRAGHRGTAIHLGDAALAPLAPLIKLFAPKAHITATACGLDVIYSPRLYQWLLKKSFSSLDKIVCISHATAEAVRTRGVSNKKIVVIPCGVWMDEEVTPRVGERREGPHLLTIGRLVPRKGVSWFVSEVIPLLMDEYPDLKYSIVGTGSEEGLIKKLVQEKGLTEGLELKSFIEDEERNKIINTADMLVVPNVLVEGDMEGFGIVCIEASSRGVPVVAARLEGLEDAVVENETGLFFESKNPEDCASAIRKMINDPLDPSSIIQATRAQYSWNHLLTRYRDEVFS